MRNSISKIPTYMPPPECQLLTTLLLQENHGIKKIPSSFFANMPSLGVLNLSRTRIECLPDSISDLKNLTALLLGDCQYLTYVPCLAKLQRLKKLDLHFTQIEEVPEGIDVLINLRYLDLRTRTLKGIPVGLLPKLSRLQHLDLYDRSNKKTSLKAEEVLSLNKLEFFKGRFEDVNELNKLASSMQQSKKNLIEYRLQVGSSYYDSERDNVVDINEFGLDGRELMLPNDIQKLRISNCNHHLRSLGDDISSLKKAIDLRDCDIRGCEGIEYVVSFSSISSSCSTHPFQSLERLYLDNLPKLSDLIKVEGFGPATMSTLAPFATFSNLKDLHLAGCRSMKTLLPHWVLPNLQNLELILVSNCDELVEILEAAPTSENETDALIKFNLPKLRDMILLSLPELKSICSKSGVLVCDSLQNILVHWCDKLKRIPPFVPLVGNGQPYEYAPPSLKIHSGTEWLESLEWDDPNFKILLQQFSHFFRNPSQQQLEFQYLPTTYAL